MLEEFKDNITGKEASRKTLFSISRSKDNHLEVYYEAYDSSLESYSNQNNSDLWRGNVVEIFFSVDNSEYYYELEVAPNGATFVSTILNRAITFVDDAFLKSEVEIKDNAYFVKMDIDLNLIGSSKIIKYNAFRVETIKDKQLLMALNPTLCGTFHIKEKFIPLK